MVQSIVVWACPSNSEALKLELSGLGLPCKFAKAAKPGLGRKGCCGQGKGRRAVLSCCAFHAMHVELLLECFLGTNATARLQATVQAAERHPQYNHGYCCSRMPPTAVTQQQLKRVFICM